MAQVIADRRDIDFVLHEQMKAEELSRHRKFSEFNKKTVDMIVTEARNLAIKEMLPTQKIGDEEGCRFENGKVAVPECFHRIYKLFREGEWNAMTEPPEWGGQGMPTIAAMAASDYFNGSNHAFMIYPGLTLGAGNLIRIFGTEKQKTLFLRKMYTGEWGGTMLLTEPQAGSDVGALTTSAVKNDDGTYSITGNKIFISGGENDLTENIIHPVLARIQGAPPGTRGISLFLVPKVWVNDDGSLGEFNDVVCTGIEEKMGIHGNATCSLTLGGKGKCRGTLLGQENKGMSAMFHMMNEARLLVGMQGFSCASASYMNAVNYARTRIQGKNVLMQMSDPNAPSVPIIEHPDVRRQLLTMKAYVEGMRSLIYYVALCTDKAKVSDNEEEKAKYKGFVEVLTPIAKGYVTDRAFDVCNYGLQVYGGYGYIRDFPQEQLLRDCRITMIYEGANGIQAMDLLGRKLRMRNAMNDLLEEGGKTIAAAKEISGLKDFAPRVEKAAEKLSRVGAHLRKTVMSFKALNAFAYAYPFMEVCGDLAMTWMLLWRAVTAAPKLEKLVGATDFWERREEIEKNKNAAFYEGQMKSAEFFIHNILPITMGKMDVILETHSGAIDITDVSFGG
ncbi:acyl-CoA dehydrogenase [Desulfonema magnum]|uniref:3-methylmercaptopropionyl-CoA dehydrogenase n=1 Tax=Desulfonema magnum TaxID=45655 RepID=A0A975BS17_9BACT|nr:acyl-CoA dehydrogenase [Desulfonema magnum]QTA90667.1 Acyl-CoA dehydrogenase [Desulfonema magnum]